MNKLKVAGQHEVVVGHSLTFCITHAFPFPVNDAAGMEMTRIHESTASIKDYVGFCRGTGSPLKHGAEQLLANKVRSVSSEN